jgi:uncharacterized RDD family membrane protein YckC
MNQYQNPFQPTAGHPEDEPPPEPQSSLLMPRIGAFAADMFCLLILFFLANFLIFSQNPGVTQELEQFTEEMREFREAPDSGAPEPTLSEEAQRLIQITYAVSLALVLLYFMMSEAFTRGASPGKLLFKLRVIRTDPGQAHAPLPLGATVMRSVIKGISLTLAMTMQPLMLLLLFNYFFAFFTRDRRAVHDYLARTKVVASSDIVSYDHSSSGHGSAD